MRSATRSPLSHLRRTVLAAGLLASAGLQSGCIVPLYSADPSIRVEQMINVSEGYRQIPEILERFWFVDTPPLATPYRVHGGVI